MVDREALDSAKRILLELEQELQPRLNTASDAEGPGMNTAIRRLSFIDVLQQHQMDWQADRQMPLNSSVISSCRRPSLGQRLLQVDRLIDCGGVLNFGAFC